VEQAHAWYQRGGYRKETALALILIGRTKRDLGDYPGALDSFTRQLEIARKLGDAQQVVLSLEGLGLVLELQGKLPEALTRHREAYETATRSAGGFNAPYNLMSTAAILWQLGRYAEAQDALTQAGANASRDLAARADRIRAAMALSERQFSAALEACRLALAQPGIRNDSTAAMKMTLGLAQAGSGKPREAVTSTREAVELVARLRNPKLTADANLAHAEALLDAGDAHKALTVALAADEQFARIGRPDLEWRCWLAAARAKLAVHDAAAAREYAAKSSEQLALLAQKWDAENFKTYSSRPDVQYDRGQLARLVPLK